MKWQRKVAENSSALLQVVLRTVDNLCNFFFKLFTGKNALSFLQQLRAAVFPVPNAGTERLTARHTSGQTRLLVESRVNGFKVRLHYAQSVCSEKH